MHENVWYYRKILNTKLLCKAVFEFIKFYINTYILKPVYTTTQQEWN